MDRRDKNKLLPRHGAGCTRARHLSAPQLWRGHRQERRHRIHRLQRCAERVVPTASTSAPAFVRRWAFRAAKDTNSCRSVHAEMNAIIAAPRDQMIGPPRLGGAAICRGRLWEEANSCMVWERPLLHGGIEGVVIRRDVDTYDTVNVHDWVENDDTLGSSMAY